MRAEALVLGDIDLVRPLGLAGIRCALFSLPNERARHSRHVDEVLPWIDHWKEPERVVAAVGEWASRRPRPPVLYPQTDGDLLALSRHRERLDGIALHCLADAELIEALLDKARFAELAQRVGLPVPRCVLLRADGDSPAGDPGVRFPVVVKPLVRRRDLWHTEAKARRFETPADLAAAWPELAASGLDVLVQEEVPGPESAIESYHAYVDPGGRTLAEFTGRKIRTWPRRYGMSTAVEITDAGDVRAAGRGIFSTLGLTGVAKADFKRDPSGGLHLLEVNPRFTLWHHPAAVAGVNVPAMVHHRLTGGEVADGPPVATPGVRWVEPVDDFLSAREEGIGTTEWLRFALGAGAASGLALGDPAPLLRSAASAGVRKVRRRLRG